MELDKKTREAIFQELEGSKYVVRKSVKVGKNQGQFFVRIPKKMSEDLGITDDSTIEFILTKNKKSKTLELAVK